MQRRVCVYVPCVTSYVCVCVCEVFMCVGAIACAFVYECSFLCGCESAIARDVCCVVFCLYVFVWEYV